MAIGESGDKRGLDQQHDTKKYEHRCRHTSEPIAKSGNFSSQMSTANASIQANCIVPKARQRHQHPTGAETNQAVAAAGKECPQPDGRGFGRRTSVNGSPACTSLQRRELIQPARPQSTAPAQASGPRICLYHWLIEAAPRQKCGNAGSAPKARYPATKMIPEAALRAAVWA